MDTFGGALSALRLLRMARCWLPTMAPNPFGALATPDNNLLSGGNPLNQFPFNKATNSHRRAPCPAGESVTTRYPTVESPARWPARRGCLSPDSQFGFAARARRGIAHAHRPRLRIENVRRFGLQDDPK